MKGLAVHVVFQNPGELDMGKYNLGVVAETERRGASVRQVLVDAATREVIASTRDDGLWVIDRIEQTYQRVFINAGV